MNRGRLFVLSGPSGAGKGTLREAVFPRLKGLSYSISCTTRPPRNGEKDGVHYRFVTEEAFLCLLNEGRFLEHAKVHGNYYGTLKEDVERALSAGEDILLEIDVQGAEQVRAGMPEAVLIFVSPPTLEELERRLAGRGTEGREGLKLRLENAVLEMSKSGQYDHVIINDDLTRASNELESIIADYRLCRREKK